MNRPTTSLDHARRVERVIVHLAEHLDQPLDLERLAAVACFSPFHFHRIYRHIAGETAADTLRRLRLHRASGELIQGKAPIAGIASRAGYGSVAAFGRVFRDSFGMPPAAYRRQGRLVPLPPRPVTCNEEQPDMYDVSIKDIASHRAAAIRHTGPYLEIGGAFEQLRTWCIGRGAFRPGADMLGLYHDDPGSVPAAELRADAVILVGDEVQAEGDVRILEVPGGRWAVIEHVGPYGELEAAYAWLYGTWLPSTAHEPDDRPLVELYKNDPRLVPPSELRTEIRLPLR